jgi:hypothetical protein
MTVPVLGPGETILVLHEEGSVAPENGEVIWAPSEIKVMSTALNGAPNEVRDMWVQYMDAVKRMYPGAKLKCLNPLVVEHPDLTPETLEDIPWQFLPRR